MIYWQLPRFLRVRFCKTVVECRLEVEEVGYIISVALGESRDCRNLCPVPDAVGPDIAIRELVLRHLGGFLEPRVLGGSGPGHEI